MESTNKMTELLKKKRPVPRKFNTYKEFDASLFKGLNTNLYNTPDPNNYINRLSFTKTPERSRPIVNLNYSHIQDFKSLGKENRSSSVSKKEERSLSVKGNRDRQHNYSMLNDKPLVIDIPEKEYKRPETSATNKYQVYLSSDRKNAHRRNLSSKKVINGGQTYKRLNSSFAETRQRVPSQDRKIGHTHKNSSLFNNSMLLDEPGNISRDQSYLKELLDDDTLQADEVNLGYNKGSPHRVEERIYDEHFNQILDNSKHGIAKNHLYEDSYEFSEKNDKHKQREQERTAPLYEKVKKTLVTYY